MSELEFSAEFHAAVARLEAVFDDIAAKIERTRMTWVRYFDERGMAVPECVPAGKRLATTGMITHCCEHHIPDVATVHGCTVAACCDPDDCSHRTAPSVRRAPRTSGWRSAMRAARWGRCSTA